MSDLFNTDNDYARQYDTWRRKEELQKLKDKYGDAEEEDSYSSSDPDSEDDPMLTNPKLQEDWLKTLTALKTKDPRIYQKDYHFFEDLDEEESDSDEEAKGKKKKKKEKPMYLKDYNRKVILEKGGVISSDEEEIKPEEKTDVVTYHEEQEELRKSVVKAAGSQEDSESDDGLGGGLLLKRRRTIHEREKERKEQEEWENKQKEKKKSKDKEVGVEAKPINTWDIPNLDEREKFLKNFILGQAYTVKDKKRIPTYDEVVYGDEDEDAFRQEEEFLEKAEKFEKRHNFRFEEYGGTQIKSYPREIKNLVRRKDTKRAEQRNVVKERKQQEKEKKKEEIKRMKNLKRQEILEKIDKLKAVTGNDTLAFNEDDLEEDFDPDKHDEMMQKYFDDEYYSVGTDEVQKPVFEMSDDEGNWDHWTGGAGPSGDHGNPEDEGLHVDDPDFCMDADYDPSVKKESRKKMKKKKNKKKLNEALEESKPVFDPNEKTFEEYVEEYYNLDYEDIIDDIPCRFKYRKVTANNFGLSTDEIINGNEKELNTWVSLKKISQYRTDAEEQYDIKAFSVKAKNEKLKQRVLHSLYVRDEDKDATASNNKEGAENEPSGKRKRKRGKKKDKSVLIDSGTDKGEQITGFDNAANGNEQLHNSEDNVIESTAETDGTEVKKKKKKKRDKSNEKVEEDKNEFDEHISADLKQNETSVGETVTDLVDTNEPTAEIVPKKKEHKKKIKEDKKGHKKQIKLSNARLKAYGIDPKKFKETSHDSFKYKYGKN